ncbi:putative aspartic endopeptidase [Lachancea thermotolerans CBS 6340]|uniref:KLTH0E02596p n=1 Tax=Lachancea thermotolerans (strain ATCC 56472 / CBS 6340 / NRRL Y-8284) TaxID=559295 RepID=C5DHA1_LACTC|nr:KLTH0E02596p [Lachancea thermotolerans CBS 6340]CAR23162.1 KLTH0E02596p [Lachancea thermotolerans CBS 6340]
MLIFAVFVFAVALVRGASQSSSENSIDSFPVLTANRDRAGLYYVNASFGTPGQSQKLRIDLVQPYMWVFSEDMRQARQNRSARAKAETYYNASKSSTHEKLNGDKIWSMHFMDHIAFNGTTVMDEVSFMWSSTSSSSDVATGDSNTTQDFSSANTSRISDKSFSFLSANEVAAYIQQGALGLAGRAAQTGYDNDSSDFDSSYVLLDRLVDESLIYTSSFSMWMGADTRDPLESPEPSNGCGKVIFGAVDTSLYTGDFVKFDTIPFHNARTGETSRGYPIIPLTKVNVQSKSGETKNMTSDSFLEPVLIDSRFRYNYLPLEIIVQIAMQANAYYVESLNRWLLACDVGRLGASIIFEFGNLSINVPLNNLMGPTFDSDTNGTLHFSNKQQACELKLLPSTASGFNVLGGAFIKNVYMAAELESNQVALAQAQKVSSVTTTSSTAELSPTPTSSKSEEGGDDAASHLSYFNLKPAKTISAIKSGMIPFATTNNLTSFQTMMLSDKATMSTSPNTRLFNQFTATISSDGVIFTGRSFYNTTNDVSVSSTTSASFALSETTSKSNAARTNFPLQSVGGSGLSMHFYSVTVLLISAAIFAL